MNDPAIITIDGPAASGKSTVARHVASTLGFIYVDSGSLYRGFTWAVLRDRVDPADTAGVLITLATADWAFDVADGAMTYTIDGRAPGEAIRGPEVSEAVSLVARIPEVRAFVSKQLRSLVKLGPLVVEGRDIGSVVFPETAHKFYLDADPTERARRRSAEDDTDAQLVQASIQRRDHLDSTRKNAPLQIPLGARVIDTTPLDAAGVAQAVLDAVETAGAAG